MRVAASAVCSPAPKVPGTSLPYTPEQAARMVQRGYELLCDQGSCGRPGCECRSEARMQRDLAFEFGLPYGELFAIATAAGARYYQRHQGWRRR